MPSTQQFEINDYSCILGVCFIMRFEGLFRRVPIAELTGAGSAGVGSEDWNEGEDLK